MRALRCAAVLILLGFTLATPCAWAVRPQTAPAPELAGQMEQTRPSLLRHLAEQWANLWSKIGCSIDPLGLCRTEPVTTQPQLMDEGCRMDPLGRCLPGQ